MEFTEYQEKLKDISQQAREAKKKLAVEYALSKNTIQIGDIIEDSIGKIKVTKIKVHIRQDPVCFYYGIILKKDGTPTKREQIRLVCQI